MQENGRHEPPRLRKVIRQRHRPSERCSTSPSIAPKFKNPENPPPPIPMPPFFEKDQKAHHKNHAADIRIAYVAGSRGGSSSPSERLAAASEYLTLAPH